MNIGMLHRAVVQRGHSFARGLILVAAWLGIAAITTQAGQQTPSNQAASGPEKAKSAPSKAQDGAAAQSAPAPKNAAASSSEAPKPAASPEAPASEAAPQEEWHRMSGTPAPATPSNAVPSSNSPAQPAAMPNAAKLRTRLNELGIRANNANRRLQSLQEQQSREGLGLRADIRDAQSRMDQQMQEAAKSLESGNLEAARDNLRYAQNAVETIEKFLGR